MKKIAEIVDNSTIHVYDLSQFDVDAIMHSGQVFRYFESGGKYRLVSGSRSAEIYTLKNWAVIKSDDSDYFYNYFDLNTDYGKIKRELGVYTKIRPAIESGGGIRILRADFAEVVISFIISANNNIKRFTKTLNLMCERYGASLSDGLYAFPALDTLAGLSELDFAALGCGYRSAYLVKAVESLRALDEKELSKLPDESLDKELRKICGVGPKVSACIMLFCGAFRRLNIAPVDTWINKALGQLSNGDKSAVLSHKYAGIAQQYIFYYLQHLRKELF